MIYRKMGCDKCLKLIFLTPKRLFKAKRFGDLVLNWRNMIKIITTLLALFVLASPAVGQLTRDQLPPDVAKQVSNEQLELTNWM
jgi:hypothetical protein